MTRPGKTLCRVELFTDAARIGERFTEPTEHKKVITMNQGNYDPFNGAPVIYRYTRQQAIEDGVLVDLSAWSRETGFTIPVACTAAVWNQYVVPPEGTKELGQSERGRAHDMIWMLRQAIRRKPGTADRLTYEVIFLNQHQKHETVTLKAICGPGDGPEAVMTILLPIMESSA